MLDAIRITGPLVLLLSLWAMWTRWVTFGSRIDRAGTAAVGFFGVGSALDSPWHAIGAFAHPAIDKFYALNLLSGLCFVAGSALTVNAVYLRLLSDDDVRTFMRRWIIPFSLTVCVALVVCFAATGANSQMPADHLRLVTPDAWLSAYWITLGVMATLLGVIATYGINRLREDPRSAFLSPTMWALMVGAAAGGTILQGTSAAGRVGEPMLVAWLATFIAFGAAMVAAVFQWWNRQRQLTTPGEDLIEPGPARSVEDPDADQYDPEAFSFARRLLISLRRTL